jgi:hypothetical protein
MIQAQNGITQILPGNPKADFGYLLFIYWK